MEDLVFKKIKVILILGVVICMGGAGCSSEVFADGGKIVWFGTGDTSSASGRTGAAGGGTDIECSEASNNKWRIDCAGLSWAYYKATGVSGAQSGVRFPTIKSYASNDLRIPSTCLSVGGFWHLGVNIRNAALITEINPLTETPLANTNIYSTISVRSQDRPWFYGHWRTANWGLYKKIKGWRNAYHQDNNELEKGANRQVVKDALGNIIYELDHYAVKPELGGDDTLSGNYEVWRAYDVALEASGVGPNDESRTSRKFPDNLWGFCYGEKMEQPKYYSVSNVSIKDTLEKNIDILEDEDKIYNLTNSDFWGDMFESAQSWGVTKQKEMSVDLVPGQVVLLTFSHNIGAKEKTDERVSWTVTRSFDNGMVENSGYKFLNCNSKLKNESSGKKCAQENEAYSTTDWQTSGSVVINERGSIGEGEFVVPVGERKYTDGLDPYLLRDQYLIGFKKSGVYRFCESIEANKDSRIKSTVCAVFNVADMKYTFENIAEVEITKDVFAGEYTGIKGTITTSSELLSQSSLRRDQSYSAKQSEVKMITYVSNNDDKQTSSYSSEQDYNVDFCRLLTGSSGSDCYQPEEGVVTDLSPGKMNISKDRNIFDAPAGRYYCAVLAVFPSRANNATATEGGAVSNVGDVEVVEDYNGDTMPWITNRGNYKWYVSKPACWKVAKRPSLQVWGGGIFVNGNANVKPAEKRTVTNVLNYTPEGNNTIVFSSWVEQNIIANGKVNIASGASTGGPGLTKKTYKDGLISGSYEESSPDICIRSPLTMPNEGCNKINLPGGTANSMSVPTDKESLIGHFINKEGTNFIKITSFDEIEKTIDEKVAKGKTYVLVNENNIDINKNIIYEDNYTSLAEIPKLIIYAKGNINISCSVDQIDAVLIAEKEVNTCYNGGDVNSKVRSRRLRVNGAIITNTMNAGRTYGAATGGDSGISAEVVNYDTSLYLWGSSKADVSDSGKLQTVYQVELAPRL